LGAFFDRLIGSPLSPYVRKVAWALGQKGQTFLTDPLVAFYGNDTFSVLSPLRRIPLLLLPTSDVPIVDSRVICEYLEEAFPGQPSLFPAGLEARSHARWVEEYAGTRLSDTLLWRLWNALSIERFVWSKPAPTTEQLHVIYGECAKALRRVEEQLAPRKSTFLFGESICTADVALAQPFVNALYLKQFREQFGFEQSYPHTAAFVRAVSSAPHVADWVELGGKLTRVPVANHRETMSQLGFAVVDAVVTGDTPRRGISRL
jgi:glutathione S-transferase